MKYHTLKMGNKELRCRLTTQGIMEVEKKLGGKNILKVIMEDEVPSLSMVLITLHAALQPLEHGYSMEAVYKLYDEYVEEGCTYLDLIPELISILEVSGFFKKVDGEDPTPLQIV